MILGAQLNSEIDGAPAGSSVRHRFPQQAQETVAGDIEQFGQFREDYEKDARLVKDLKIKVS